MKLQNKLFLSAFAAIGLALTGSSAYAQTFPTTGNNFIWQGQAGDTFETPNNWVFKGATLSSTLATKVPPSADAVFFGFPGTPGTSSPTTISFDPNDDTSRGASFDVMSGNFTFDLNGSQNIATVLGTTKAWTFGGGTLTGVTGGNVSFPGGNGPTVNFIDSSTNANTITFGAVTLGATDSSNNVWGGQNATITFGSNVTSVITGVVTVGSADGGSTGNVFNAAVGQSLGGVVVNAGIGNAFNGATGESFGSGGITVNGGSATLVGNTTITGGGLALNGGTLTSNGVFSINDTNGSVALAIAPNGSFTLSGGSTVTNTGSNLSSAPAGFAAVTTGTGSTLTIDNSTVTVSNVALSGTTTIQNGGSVTTSESTAALKDNVAGNLTVTGAGSSFNGGTNGVGGNENNSSALILASGAEISVINGGSFNLNTALETSGGTNVINVDSQSTFTTSGPLESAIGASGSTNIQIQGGGTVSVGSYAIGATGTGLNNLTVADGTTFSVNNLTLSAGTSNLAGTSNPIAFTGTVAVTSSLAGGGVHVSGAQVTNPILSSGQNLEINGAVSVTAGGDGTAVIIGSGGTLSGVGSVKGGVAVTNGGEIMVASGGTLSPGMTGETFAQALQNKGGLELASAAILKFNLFDDGTNDQLQSQFALATSGSFTLTLNLVGDQTQFTVGETFNLFTDLTGDQQGQTGGTFALDSATISAFAADGLSVDTSTLGTNGMITLDAAAVPEPSTWALLFIGAGALVFFNRCNALQREQLK